MANYWKKINLETVGAIRMRARISSEINGDHIEALVLHTVALEALLRTLITSLVGHKKKTHIKYWDGDAKFSQLITYYELLGGKRAIITALQKYNSNRNKIIHQSLMYKNIDDLIREAESTYKEGVVLSMKILRILGFKIPKDFSSPLPFTRPWIDLTEGEITS